MKNDIQDFYEKWAEKELKTSPYRHKLLDWNAHCLYKLYQNNQFKIEHIAEIGGAEGHVLGGFLQRLGYLVDSYNFELSQEFINFGKDIYKDINFIKMDVANESINYRFDLVILSDIIEHIENDITFLNKVSSFTQYALIKLPIERCLHIKFLRKINKLPPLGPTHFAGHLHDYDINSGFALVSKNFQILNSFYEDLPLNLREAPSDLTIFGKLDHKLFYKTSRICLPKKFHFLIYGGCLFLFGKSKRFIKE